MSIIDDVGTWLLRKTLSALPQKEEGDKPEDEGERLRRIWLREDEYALLVSVLLDKFKDEGYADLVTSRAVRRWKSVQFFIPQREVPKLADALHQLVVERRRESLELLRDLPWGDSRAEEDWSDRADLTRALTVLRDAFILQGKIDRGDRF